MCCWYILGVFYYQLGNISPQYRSLLRSIQLVAVAECSIILKYGSNKILEPFMADIHKLEQVRLLISGQGKCLLH